MKKQLIVLDFDKTLLPYDSFRKFVFHTGRNNVIILFIALIRKLRLISAVSFKRAVSRHLLGIKNVEQLQIDFANALVKDLDQGLLEKVRTMQAKVDAEVLLLSASPHGYINAVAESLGFTGQGSFFTEDRIFVHMHGEEKIRFLNQFFPQMQYNYFYSASDHASDFSLLNLFEHNEIVKR